MSDQSTMSLPQLSACAYYAHEYVVTGVLKANGETRHNCNRFGAVSGKFCSKCPKRTPITSITSISNAPAKPRPKPVDWTETARALWKELSSLVGSYRGDAEAFNKGLDSVQSRLPVFGCKCSGHMSEYRKNNPPPLGIPVTVDYPELKTWLVKFRNNVTARIDPDGKKGKKQVTFDEAAKFWGWI